MTGRAADETCPTCGRAIDGIGARAPADHELSCGCAATLTTRAAVEGSETRLVTDGGQSNPTRRVTLGEDCPNCEREITVTDLDTRVCGGCYIPLKVPGGGV